MKTFTLACGHGSLGGLIKMNAGLKGRSISDTLLEIGTSDATLSKDDCGFAYRKSDIKGVIFEAASCGCDFDNCSIFLSVQDEAWV